MTFTSMLAAMVHLVEPSSPPTVKATLMFLSKKGTDFNGAVKYTASELLASEFTNPIIDLKAYAEEKRNALFGILIAPV